MRPPPGPRLTLQTLGARTARQLDISPGDACLILNRRTWLQGTLITDVRLTYPASRHRFSPRARVTRPEEGQGSALDPIKAEP